MFPPPERRWLRLLAGYLVFVGCLALIVTPLYLYVEFSHRPVVIRLAAAVVVGIALFHLRGIVRERIDAQPASAFELALRRAPMEPRLTPFFFKLWDEVRFSTTSQKYFERVLWPRVLALLARGSGGRPPAVPPVMPAGRRLLRRGPSLGTLRNLIGRIEEGP
jgi:hypothetical protein